MSIIKNGGISIWIQILLGMLLLTLSGLGILNHYIITRIESDLRTNRNEFYAKMDRVVSYYKDEHRTTMDSIAKLCETVGKHGETLSKHDTLLHLNYPTRKEFFKEHGLERK